MTYNPGLAAATSWKEDYADLRLSYDRAALDAALLAFIRTEMAEATKDADEELLYVLLCGAFVQLHKRGAIRPIRPLSSEGERQHNELLQNFNIVAGAREVDNAITLRDEVLFDWKNLSSNEFKAKRKNPAFDQMFAQLANEGAI